MPHGDCPAETREDGFVYANGGNAAILSRSGLAGKLVPDHLQDAVREVGDTWTLETHGRASWRAAKVAMNNSFDYLVQRMGGLIGPVDLTEGLRDLADRGVRNLMVVALGADKLKLMDGLGEGIAGLRSR